MKTSWRMLCTRAPCANQIGYLVGALVGGTVIAVAGYGAFGVVLAAVMSVSALLILRVDDPA